MALTVTSLMTALFFSSILMAAAFYLLKYNSAIKMVNINIVLFIFFIVMFRLLVPTEFMFTKSLGIQMLYRWPVRLLRAPVLTLGGFSLSVVGILGLVWAAGCLITGAKFIKEYAFDMKKIAGLPVVDDPMILNALSEAKQIVKCKRVSPRVVRCDEVDSPFIFGVFRPTIVLSAIELPAESWRYIFVHELMHYKRHDVFSKFLAEVLCIIYWWNPLVYMLKNQLAHSIEMSVDQTVFKRLNAEDTNKYLDCLLAVAEYAVERSVQYTVAFSEQRRPVVLQRFDLMNDYIDANGKKLKQNKFITVGSFILVLAFAVLSFGVVFEPYREPPSSEEIVSFVFEPKDLFAISSPEGNYNVYSDGKLAFSVSTLGGSLTNVPVYDNIEEAKLHEKL